MPTSMLETLRQVRRNCQLSQLELSLRLGVSQRHISFVESGRSKPSRDLLVAWLQELNTPLIVRNEIMLQAGYAPVYNTAQLNDPTLTHVNHALQQLLSAHDPQPALVIDAQWNLVRINRGGQWLAAALMPGMSASEGDTPINFLDMLIHPEGLTQSITNLHEVGPAFLTRLRHEASTQPCITPKVDAFAALLDARLGVQYPQKTFQKKFQETESFPAAPILTTSYATQYGELSFFSMFTTFGTPQDITLESLRVEHMFAADKTTHAVLREQVQ